MQSGRSFFRLFGSLGLVLTLAGFDSNLSADEAKKSEEATVAAAGAEVPLGEFIDQQIRQGWQDNEIEASAAASDEEWVRRHYDPQSLRPDEEPRPRQNQLSYGSLQDYTRQI